MATSAPRGRQSRGNSNTGSHGSLGFNAETGEIEDGKCELFEQVKILCERSIIKDRSKSYRGAQRVQISNQADASLLAGDPRHPWPPAVRTSPLWGTDQVKKKYAVSSPDVSKQGREGTTGSSEGEDNLLSRVNKSPPQPPQAPLWPYPPPGPYRANNATAPIPLFAKRRHVSPTLKLPLIQRDGIRTER